MIGVTPETAEIALKNWDSGEPVMTVELGGLGPGYEQCIHIGIFELIRAALIGGYVPDLRDASFAEKILDPLLMGLDNRLGLHLSGAQAGMIKSFAFHVLKEGWASSLKEVPTDRHIQVSKHWPQLESYAREGAHA